MKLGILIFEVTDACNQNCRFCYNYWKAPGGGNAGETPVVPEPPSYKRARRTLRRLFRQATVESLSFSGGEPMLMPRLADLLLMTRLHKTRVNVLTNGTLLTPQGVDLFKTLDVGRVQIPILSADPSVHNALTEKEGAWEKAVSALQSVLAWQPNRASAVLILTGENITGLRQTLAFYRELGVKSVLVNRFNVGGNGLRHRESLTLSHTQLRQAFREIETFAATSNISFSSGVCTPICVLNPSDYPHIAFSFCNTNVMSRPITLSYKGDVRFCNHSPRIMGNIYERTLEQILNDPATSAYYAALPQACTACPHLSRCQGGCRAASEQVFHDFSQVDPLINTI